MASEFSRELARQLSECHSDIAVRELYLEWVVDHFVAIELTRHIEGVAYCYEHLTSKVFWYGDMDGFAKRVSWEGAQAFTHEDQHTNFVYVYRPVKSPRLKPGLSIYRYWKRTDNKWPHSRPTITTLRKQQGTTYNDSRDEAWVATLGPYEGIVEDGMIDRYSYFSHALFCLRLLERGLREETAQKDNNRP